MLKQLTVILRVNALPGNFDNVQRALSAEKLYYRSGYSKENPEEHSRTTVFVCVRDFLEIGVVQRAVGFYIKQPMLIVDANSRVFSYLAPTKELVRHGILSSTYFKDAIEVHVEGQSYFFPKESF